MKSLLVAGLASLVIAVPASLASRDAQPTHTPPPHFDPPPSFTAENAAFVARGRVTDAGSGLPLGGVQVFVPQTGEGGLTDAAGRYTIELKRARDGDRVTLHFRLIGFAAVEHTVVLAGETLELDVALQPATVELDEVVVSGAGSAQPAEERQAARKRVIGNSVRTTAADQLAPASVMRHAAPASPLRFDPEFNTEAYAHIVENGFRHVEDHPLSTFSIDVDRASYANVRRFITSGVRPPVDAVRIEELVNYFAYQYDEPRGRHPFAVDTDVMRAPWNDDNLLVRVGLQGRKIDMSDAPPSNLVFLMDVSGSMQSPDKLPLLKQAFGLLVDQLRPQDRVAVVVYAGAAGLVLPSTAGNRREVILDAIESLEAGGSTAGGAGLQLAYRVAQENYLEGGNNRVILATDGDFNVGPSSDAEMIRLVESAREDGTFLTVLGFGTGNLKDSKMEQVADHGNGNYAYIDSVLEAKKVLVTEMGGTLLTIAKDVKIQVEFNPAVVASYRLIGYENRLLANEDFNDDRKDAGELGAGHAVTALYEIVPVGADGPPPAVDPLRYQRDDTRTERTTRVSDATFDDELLFVKLRYKQPDGDRSILLSQAVQNDDGRRPDAELRFAAAVAGFGMLLRDSEHCGDLELEDVLALASSAIGPDEDGTRSEFLQIVRQADRQRLLGSS